MVEFILRSIVVAREMETCREIHHHLRRIKDPGRGKFVTIKLDASINERTYFHTHKVSF